MSDGALSPSERSHGVGLLPPDLTSDELAGAPVLESLDALVVDLDDEEDDAFGVARSTVAKELTKVGPATRWNGRPKAVVDRSREHDRAVP
jgi:hypothetical protein